MIKQIGRETVNNESTKETQKRVGSLFDEYYERMFNTKELWNPDSITVVWSQELLEMAKELKIRLKKANSSDIPQILIELLEGAAQEILTQIAVMTLKTTEQIPLFPILEEVKLSWNQFKAQLYSIVTECQIDVAAFPTIYWQLIPNFLVPFYQLHESEQQNLSEDQKAIQNYLNKSYSIYFNLLAQGNTMKDVLEDKTLRHELFLKTLQETAPEAYDPQTNSIDFSKTKDTLLGQVSSILKKELQKGRE